MEMDYNLSPLEIAVNHSFSCHSHLSALNVTGMVNDVAYDLPLMSDLTSFQIQAYNEIIGEKDFVDCEFIFVLQSQYSYRKGATCDLYCVKYFGFEII